MVIEAFKHLPNDIEYYYDLPGRKLPLEVVDTFADAFVAYFENPDYRKWYCGVIYEFGLKKVNEWFEKSRTGEYPGKLFTKYVNSARGSYSQKGSTGGTSVK